MAIKPSKKKIVGNEPTSNMVRASSYGAVVNVSTDETVVNGAVLGL